MSEKCAVCEGSGRYPVITASGRELYTIECPECGGGGVTYSAEEIAEACRANMQRMKYEAAMAEKRARPDPLS